VRIGERPGREPGLVIREERTERRAPRATPKVWLEVPDARAAADSLSAAGQALVSGPFAIRTGWVVEIADSWGNVIGLTDYVNMPAMARPTAAK
jgi:predicted enzyme related to lactoylglutathione lyase